MSKRDISVFSLSLLDLLFCAFGGVIVLTVVFSAIIKYEQAQIEESPQTAFYISVEYSRAEIFPVTYNLQLRKVPHYMSLTSGIDDMNIFQDRSFSIFRNMDQNKQGKFTIGFEGNIHKTQKNDFLADTLYLKLYDTELWLPSEVWPQVSGQISISMVSFKTGELPKTFSLPPIDARKLYRVNQSLPIVLELSDDNLTISTL